MQLKKNIISWTLILAIISCTKEQGVPGATGAQGSAGTTGKGASSDTASIIGNLQAYNEFGISVAPSGIVVTLSSNSQEHKDTTDASGNYVFPGIETGTYDLTFQRSGYGTMKLFGVSHFGGGTMSTNLPTNYLLQIPIKTVPDTLILTTDNFNQATFNLKLDTSSLQYTEISEDILVYIAKGRTGSPSDYDILINENINPDGIGGYTANFNKISFPNIPTSIKTGDTLYAVAYTFNRYIGFSSGNSSGWSDLGLSSYYMDPSTGKYVYPNLSKPSNVIKFVF
jgi:hypothetical protein